MAKTVLFIHGMFMNALCWENWLPRFKERGYKVVTPSWKFHEGEPATLRSFHPNPALGNLTLNDVVNQCADIVRGMQEQPIIVGHSMGGLVTQILLNRNLGAAGVALDPAPPRWVFTLQGSFFKANYPIIDPLQPATVPISMTFPQFQYGFVNTMPEAEQKAAYERYVVPESRQVGRGGFSSVADLDYSRTYVPLLVTAGSIDHTIPAALSRANFGKYRRAPNVAFKEFEGRNHFLIGQKGWEEVADYVLGWLMKRGL